MSVPHVGADGGAIIAGVVLQELLGNCAGASPAFVVEFVFVLRVVFVFARDEESEAALYRLSF